MPRSEPRLLLVCFNMVLGERLELPMFVCLLTKEVQSPLCQPSIKSSIYLHVPFGDSYNKVHSFHRCNNKTVRAT